MHMFGTITVGMAVLLGSQAHAALPVINEARASWQGCDYSIKVRQDVAPIPGQFLFRISVQSEVVSPGTCLLVPKTVELGTSKLVPQIAIAANDEGLAVAYSWGEHIRGLDDLVRTRIHRLDPSTLESVRVEGLSGQRVPVNEGEAGGPGGTYVTGLTIYPGYLEVRGTLRGNSITEDSSAVPSPYPIAQGPHFIAIYRDFFGVTQEQPFLFTF